MRRSTFFRAAAALLLGATLAAPAQFTSQWGTVYLPGTFNGYDTVNQPMRLISNGVWQAYQLLTNSVNTKFLFATPFFTNTWKETNQSQFGIPMSGTAEYNSGNDISITGRVSGLFRFTFNDVTGAYSVKNVSYGTAPAQLWVNEVHYDNTGTDANEGVEIAGAAGTSLSGYSIVAYNGNGGVTYGTTPLSGTLVNDTQNGLAVKWVAIAGLQNDMDGFALIYQAPGVTNVIQFLSYEGSFTAANGPAAGLNSTDIGVSEDSSTPTGQSLQLAGTGSQYADFSWIGPVPHTRDQINSNQLALAGPGPAATVAVTSYSALPPTALTNQTMKFAITLAAQNGASNMSVTTFYRAGVAGAFLPLAMTNAGSTFTTTGGVPPQVSGTTVSFYYHINFDGPGLQSPALFPANAPATTLTAEFGPTLYGSVWINEVDTAGFLGDQLHEFVELAGVAGANISGWKLEMIDENTNTYATYTIPTGKVMPQETAAGFGFYLIGDSDVSGVDTVFTNIESGAGQLYETGGLRLYNANGVLLQSLCYGLTALSGFTYIGYDDDMFQLLEDDSLGMTGTGSNLVNFTWVTNTPPSANGVNASGGQTLVNGNTNPILPFIQCPADIRLACPTSSIPATNPSLCIATGFCGNGSVIVTWVSDVTNSGTGCKGNPKIITRTYRAVSTNCSPASTNSCSQFIILEDTNAPAISVPTQMLVNADFEFGSLTGWKTFGLKTNESVNVADPRSGAFHGVMIAPYDDIAPDATGNAFDGFYKNGTVRGQPPATTSLLYSAQFDGVNDYVSLPNPLNLNGVNMTITCWMKRNGSQVGSAGVVFSRAGTTLSGLDFTSGNQLGYHWNGAASTYNWLSGVVPPDNQWAFIALTVSSNRADLYMKAGASNWVSAANITNHTADAFDGELRLGHDNTGNRYYKGWLDDVQIYNRTLSFSDITNLWNNGQGNTSTDYLIARWRLDDPFPGGSQLGLYQDLPAAPSQTWNGAIWAKPVVPLQGTNKVWAALQFLNASTGVISTTLSTATISGTSPTNQYTRMTAKATSPAGTVKARLLAVYQQDSVYSQGSVNIDDALLTSTLITAGSGINSCGVMPNYLSSSLVTIQNDDCSGASITKTQSPASGTALTNDVIPVTITASDQCGNTAQATFNVYVDDQNTPIAFGATPASTTSTCATNEIATTFIVLDNCPGWTVELISVTTNAGSGCVGDVKTITKVYQITDLGGNTKTANQTINVTDNVAPVVTVAAPALADAGFESGALATNWTAFGDNVQVLGASPHGGSFHAKLSGSGGSGTNYSGFYQTLAAQAGDTWRLGAWIMTPTNDALGAAKRVEAKIEFLDEGGLLATVPAPVFTNTAAPGGVYRQVAVSAVAPAGTVYARGTFVMIQSNNAPGAAYIDDTSLSRTTYSATNACGAAIGDITSIATASDCGNVTVTQAPPAGATINLGTNNVGLYAVDNCGNTRTTLVAVVVVDDEPPLVTGPTNIVVPTVNDVPAPAPSFITNADCSAIAIVTNLPDTNNGGAGTTNNPLIITRTYLSTDAWGNTAPYQHLITVSGAGASPPPPTNVAVTAAPAPMGDTNFTVRSTGTNTWSVLPEYATNLLGLQQWFAASNVNTVWSNGTNITTFTIPTNRPAYIRVKQTYP